MSGESSAVGIVGLGLMGEAMVRQLRRLGRTVVGFDVDQSRRASMEALGILWAEDLPAVVAAADVVILSLPNGTVAKEVCLGPNGLGQSAAPERNVLIDTTTARPSESIEIHEALAMQGIPYADVGVSGSSEMVGRGKGTAIVAGLKDAEFARVMPILEQLCDTTFRLDAAGAGMQAKLVVNLVLAVNRTALAEGLVLAERLGMPPQLTLEILRSSAASSTAMTIWGPRMVQGNYSSPTSRVRQHIKDVEQILELGRDSATPLPTMSVVANLATTAFAMGLAEADNSVVAEVMRRLSGNASVDELIPSLIR